MIDALAYIGFVSPCSQDWLRFGPEILGLQATDIGPNGVVRLRNDDAAWRIAIHPGSDNDLAYLGWSVSGPEELAGLTAQLQHAGVQVHGPSQTLADDRQVQSAAWFVDPFGFRHELVYGQRQGEPFIPGQPGVAFVTGDQGLGHGVLIVPDWDVATDFYVDVLGFRISDDIHDGITVRFLHCNRRHHSLAFTAIPGMTGFHHLMLEVSSPLLVDTAWNRVIHAGQPIAMSLGTHTNDHMYSFYVRSPSGFEVEYGSGGRVIDTDAPWHPGRYDAMSSSGHDRPTQPLLPGILHAIQGSPT